MAPRILEALEDPPKRMLEELFKPRRARRGRVFFRPGDRAEHVYYLEDGWVRIFVPDEGEGEVTLAVVGPGEIFGEAALHGDREYGVYAEVMSPGEVYVAPGDKLLRVAARYPEAGALVVRLLTERLWRLQNWMKELRYQEVRPRLVRMLLNLMREGERGLEVALSHRDLAHLIGSTRETVTKMLGELAEAGLLELGYRKVIVRDPEGLAAYVEA